MRRTTMLLLAGVVTTALAGALVAYDREPLCTRPCLPHDLELADGLGTIPHPAISGVVLVANQFSGDAALVDLATGDVTTIEAGGDPHDAVVSPDGRWGVVSDFGSRVAEGYSGNTLTIVDLGTKSIARRITTGEHRGLHDLTFRPGSPTRVLVTAQTSRRVLEVDVTTGEIIAAIDTRGDRSHTLAVSPDGRSAFTTNEGTATISRRDLTTGGFGVHFPASENVEGIAVTADGREVWTGEQSQGTVTVRDAASGNLLATFSGFRNPIRLMRSPDGGRIVISDPGCKAIVAADPATRRLTRVIGTTPLGSVLVGDFAGAAGIVVASALNERKLAVIDLDSGTVIASHRVGWHPDGLGWGPASR
jgi:DNA-binding beta-propeller fold protein YncE